MRVNAEISFAPNGGHWEFIPLSSISFTNKLDGNGAVGLSDFWDKYSYWKGMQGIDQKNVLEQVSEGVRGYKQGNECRIVTGSRIEVEIIHSWMDDPVWVERSDNIRPPLEGYDFMIINGQHRLYLVHNCAFTKEQAERLGFDLGRMFRDGDVYRLSPDIQPPYQKVPVIVRDTVRS